MTGRSASAVLVSVLLTIAPSAAAGQTRCAAIVDRDEKLRCYEAIDADLARAQAEPQSGSGLDARTDDPTQIRHTGHPRAVRHKGAVEGEVASATYTAHGVVFALGNGSRWRQIDNVPVRPDRVIGKPAKVKPGLVGGWLLEIKGQPEAVRVTPSD